MRCSQTARGRAVGASALQGAVHLLHRAARPARRARPRLWPIATRPNVRSKVRPTSAFPKGVFLRDFPSWKAERLPDATRASNLVVSPHHSTTLRVFAVPFSRPIPVIRRRRPLPRYRSTGRLAFSTGIPLDFATSIILSKSKHGTSCGNHRWGVKTSWRTIVWRFAALHRFTDVAGRY